MKLQDCTTIASLVDYAHLEYAPSELPGMLQDIINRAAEIGGEKVKEAAQQTVRETDLKFTHLINEAIRTLDVKQIIESE